MARDVNHATLGECFNCTDGKNYKITYRAAEHAKL
jgi:hypothetical protein